MRGLRSCSTRRTYKVITSLPNSTIPIKKQHSSDLSAGAVFVSIRVLLFGEFCPLFTVGTQMFTASSDCAVCGTISAKRADVAILTFFALIDESYCYIIQEWNGK